MIRDTYAVLKLVSGEEILCSVLEENEHEMTVMFPMVIKLVHRFVGNKPIETISIAPYSYFSASDEYTFQKNHIIVAKDMSSEYVRQYHLSVDDFIHNTPAASHESLEEVEAALDKISNVIAEVPPDDSPYSEQTLDEFIDDQSLVKDIKKIYH
jgi:hypothetical protein